MAVVQSLNSTELKNNSAVTIDLVEGTALFWCTGNPPQCVSTTYDKVPLGAYVCAHTFLNPDGSFSGGKIFFNSVCTWQQPPDSDGDGLSDGCEVNMTNTDPLNSNSDGVGPNDVDEDPDKDGLTNKMECDKGTDPLKADTDSDGVNDRDDSDPLNSRVK